MRVLKLTETRKLLLIILGAIATRVFTLWIGKPAFSGWLNHTYYYFVQVRGVLSQGGLPYADMPFLFYVYGFVAEILCVFGVAQATAIVSATRLVMCLVLALVPIPFYFLIKRINEDQPIQGNQWILIFISGFLPLTISHGPEFSQKNMLGLLFLSLLLFYSRRLFETWSVRDRVTIGVLALLIVMAHYGTFAAMILYGFSAFLAFAFVSKNRKHIFVFGAVLILCVIVAMGFVFLFDSQRYERLFVYLNNSISHSLLFAFFTSDQGRFETVGSLGGIAIFYVILFWFYRIYDRHRENLWAGDRIFWLANILCCGLLIFPLWDQQLMGRLALFLSVPLLVIFIYHEKYGFRNTKLKTGFHILMAVGVVVLAFGEVMSAKFHNRHHKGIWRDIEALQAQRNFGTQDLVIAPTGAEHICNWFFNVKAGVITSFQKQDFEKYNRIYVLNPIQGKLNFRDIEGRTAESEGDRYLFMRRNIPKPQDVTPLFDTQNIELFELKEPPDEWHFTSDGRWNGYGN